MNGTTGARSRIIRPAISPPPSSTPISSPNVSRISVTKTENPIVRQIVRMESDRMRSDSPAMCARAISVTRIPASEQRIVEGKNSVGRIIASKMPNCESASAAELPACRSVKGTSASFAAESPEVSAEPAITGTASRK